MKLPCHDGYFLCLVREVTTVFLFALSRMPRSDRSKAKKDQIGELSLLVNGLSFSSLDVGSIKDAIRKLDARLEENTAR